MLWVSLCFDFMPTLGLSNLLFLKHFNAVLIQSLFSRLVINECTRPVSIDIAWCEFIVHWFLCRNRLSEPADTKEPLGSEFLFSLLDCQCNITASFLCCCFIILSPLPFLHSPTQPFNDRLCCSFRSWWSLTAVTGSSAIGSGFTLCSKCSAWSRRWSGVNGLTPRTKPLL